MTAPQKMSNGTKNQELDAAKKLLKQANKLGTPVTFLLQKKGTSLTMRYRVNGELTPDHTTFNGPMAIRRELAQLLWDYYNEKDILWNLIPGPLKNDAAFQACTEAHNLQQRLRPYAGKIHFHACLFPDTITYCITEKRMELGGESHSFEDLTLVLKNYDKYLQATTQKNKAMQKKQGGAT